MTAHTRRTVRTLLGIAATITALAVLIIVVGDLIEAGLL